MEMSEQTKRSLYDTLYTVSGYFGYAEYVKQSKGKKRLKQFSPSQEQLEISDMMKVLLQDEVSQEDEESIKAYIMTLRMSRGILNKIYLDIENLIEERKERYPIYHDMEREIQSIRHYASSYILKVYNAYMKVEN